MKKLAAVLLTLILVVSMNVQPSKAATIRLSDSLIDIQIGQTQTLKVNGTKKKVTWKSSKKSVATVSSKGKVTGKKSGKTIVSAKVSGKTLKCTVYVEAPTFSSEVYKIPVETSHQIRLNYSDYGTVKWYSSNKAIATVDSTGMVTTKAKKGDVIIKATYRKKNYTCTVSVISYEDNYNDLKEQIQNSKLTDEDGNHYVGMRMKSVTTNYDTDAIVGVYYLEDEDLFKFAYVVKGGSYVDLNEDGNKEYIPDNTTLYMYLNIINSNTAKVSLECELGDESLNAKGEIDASAYGEPSDEEEEVSSVFSDITYTDQYIEDSLSDDYDEEDSKEESIELSPEEEEIWAGMICDLLFDNAMFNWDTVLESYVGLDMTDLGFISYDSDIW